MGGGVVDVFASLGGVFIGGLIALVLLLVLRTITQAESLRRREKDDD
jgi:hypothetical protein